MGQPLQRAKVYRNVELRQQWLGLEPFDAIGIGALAWLLMLLNRHGTGWNVLVVLVAYFGLRVAKRGKPDGYTTSLIRYHLRRPFFSAAARDVRGAAHPFPCSPDPSSGRMVRPGFAPTRPLGADTEGEIP